MNDEEDAAMVVMQESHPPSLIEEQLQPETHPGTEQVERGDRFQAFDAAALVEVEQVDVIQVGLEVGDSSSPAERSGQVIVGAENEGEGEDKASLLTEADSVALVEELGAIDEYATEGEGQAEKDEKLDGGVESQTAMKQDAAQFDGKMDGDREAEEVSEVNGENVLTVASEDCETLEEGNQGITQPVEIGSNVVNESEIELKEETREKEVEGKKEIKGEDSLVKDGNIPEKNKSEREEEVVPIAVGEGKGLEEEKVVCNESREVKEASPFGDTVTEGNQADVKIELSKEEDAPKAKELLPFGEEEKMVGDREAETDKKQDNQLNAGVETAKIDEKMGGDREMEEADSSQINADGLFPEPVQDSGGVEDGKTEALGTEAKVVKESEIGLEEGTEEMEVEEREIKTEERHLEAKEDKEMDDEEEKEMEADESGEAPKSVGGKRKRGRNSKPAAKAPPRKIVGEDVCFICLDGGDLVLCDRRGCPKAYHPSCVDRDEAFFRTKGLWNCGWHLCRQCKKNAHYMCYTCQCSLCKGCLTDDAAFFCVRGSKGLCQTCMKSVALIENNEGNDGVATFDDKSSMDYLFKDYWIEQKENLSLTSDEIARVINRWKRSNADDNLERLPDAHAGNTEGGVVSDSSLGTAEATKSERKKSKKRNRSSTTETDYDADGSAGKAEATGTKKRGRRHLKSQPEGADPNLDNSSKDSKRKKAKKQSTNEHTSSQSNAEWASKELLEFVAHVKNGDKSALSQFDVQELLLEYVKRNKLRDPRRSSQIVCDAILQKLFGMPRLGHIEMLKLLESHFFVKEDSQGDDNQGSVLDVEVSQLGTDDNTDSLMDVGKSRGRKARKRGSNKGLQSNLDDYAAIDMHNINLIYLRRNLIEALMEDRESLHEKIVGSFVRIKITGSNQKQDIYRLVQVIGTPKAPEPYKVGKRIADCMLEILNLNKTDVIPIDIISNQDFDEDECKRLRQSIKCGFLSRLTVGDVLDKAKDLHVVRVTDLLETEITRINHLRDRASDLGRKKELRECVEKSLLLNTPEERQRRLGEIPVVHADPNMDPRHESEDESEPEKGRDIDIRLRESSFSRREREHFPSRKGDYPSTDSWSSTPKSPSKKWEPTRSLSGKGFSSRSGDTVFAEEPLSGRPRSPVCDKMSSQSINSEKLITPPDSLTAKQGQLAVTRTNASANTPSETSLPSSTLVQNETKISETEKLWHYKDPTAKIQGPFSIVQLRKWNKNGYFPANLRIWRTSQSENDSILLTEALAGRFEKEPSQPVAKPVEAPSQPQPVHRGPVNNNTPKIDQNRGAGITRNTTDQLLPVVQRSQSDPRFSSNDSANRPTSSQSVTPGSTGRVRVSRWSGSPTPIQLPTTPTGAGPLPGAIGVIQSPTTDSSQVRKSSSSPSYERNRSFDRSHSTQQSSREAVGLPRNREDERLGSAYAQKPSSQPTVAPGPPRLHVSAQQTLQSVSEAATVSSNNNAHGPTNNVAQPAAGQNPASSAHGWGSGGYELRPEMMNSNNTNAPTLQGQQQAYGHWPATQANTLPPPPPPPYGAGQATSSVNYPAQNFSTMPSQATWTPQVPAAQPNMQVGGTTAAGSQGVATTQFPGGNAGWAQMQAYLSNMSWLASQQGSTGAAVVQASGPAPGVQLGNMNQGWVAPAANPGVAGPWNNWQQPQGGSGMVASGPQSTNGQMVCPYLLQGHCQKGPTCEFRHS